MQGIIEQTMSEIKMLLDKNKDEIIRAIAIQKNEEIAALTNQLRAKEIEVNDLKIIKG